MNLEYQDFLLGDVLTREKIQIDLDELTFYSRITIQMNSQGVALRDRLIGSLIGTKKQFLVKEGQFILSKIDARNGAFGIVPSVCDGAIITGNFWVFNIEDEVLDPRYFEFFTRTSFFTDFCLRSSEGTTNRRYLQESLFLSQKIPLPPLEEQRRIVARIEALATKIEEAQKLRQETNEDCERLLSSAYREIAEGAEVRLMGEIAPLVRRPIEVNPFGNYSELGVRSFGKGTFHKPTLTGADIGEKRIFEIQEGDLVSQIQI